MTKARDISRYGLGVGIQSAGSVVTGVGITQLNFIGTGNTFRVSGGTVDISISGGGGVGQHIARATGTQGCVIMGGTDAVNMSYPDYFRIIQRKQPVYSPMRISSFQSNLAERLNKECIEYTEDEILNAYEKIKEDIENI